MTSVYSPLVGQDLVKPKFILDPLYNDHVEGNSVKQTRSIYKRMYIS